MNNTILLTMIAIILIATSTCVMAETTDINTLGTDITIDGNDVKYAGKTIGNITEVNSIADVEKMIQDKEAIKEVYTSGLEYLANEGQYYVFEKNDQLYVMFIEQSTTDIAIACKNVCQDNSQVDFNTVDGATSANGFDLDIRGSDFLR